jgi:hypothetical protein
MNNEQRQRAEEITVFRKFAKVYPLNICLQSIEQPDVPRPDIFCRIFDGTKIEFELGEAVDQNSQRHLCLSIDQTFIGMREYYDSLPKTEKILFSLLYGDANMEIHFKGNATKRKRQNAYSDIFRYLSSIKPGFTGKLKEGCSGFPLICKRIRIDRGVIGGPLFYEGYASSLIPSVYEVIKSKFEICNSYESKGQLELLVHSFNRPLVKKDMWIKKVQEYLQKNLANSQFKRVWVFDFHKTSIEYVYPEPNVEH